MPASLTSLFICVYFSSFSVASCVGFGRPVEEVANEAIHSYSWKFIRVSVADPIISFNGGNKLINTWMQFLQVRSHLPFQMLKKLLVRWIELYSSWQLRQILNSTACLVINLNLLATRWADLGCQRHEGVLKPTVMIFITVVFIAATTPCHLLHCHKL